MKRRNISALFTAVSASFVIGAVSPSLAQPADGGSVCGINSPEQFKQFVDIFLGEWHVKHLEGVVVSGGIVIPFPADGETEIITISLGDGMLIATHPELAYPMEIGRLAGDIWGFAEEGLEHGLPLPETITQDVVENMAGCSMDQLPNLLGLVTVDSNGILMHFAWYFTLVDSANMIVAQHVTALIQGVPMISRRMVQLTSIGAPPSDVPLPEMDFSTLPEMDFSFD